MLPDRSEGDAKPRILTTQTAEAEGSRGLGGIPFEPVGTAPLRSGSVANVQPGSPKVYARERYVLSGAHRDARLAVRLLVHLFDRTCSNRPVVVATTPLATDASGDGSAELVIRPEDVPAAVRGAAHGVRWEVLKGGTVAYRTACSSVELA